MVFKIRTLSLPEPRSQEDLLLILGSPLKKFSFHELVVATNNFSNRNIVGRGGFGKVYRGILRDGSAVAVKRLKEERTQGGELQFQKEVEIGGSLASNHRNVLRLRGYCMTRKERLLVYPFMENTSVASRLRERSDSEPPLDWATRKRIALGAAKGLAHFHSGSSSFTVIHRDVKAANILLDHQFEAVLCDFGLAKFVGRNSNEGPTNSGWVQRPMEEDNEDPFEEEDESDEENKNCFTQSCWNLTKTLIIKLDYDDEAREGTKRSCWQVTKNEVISISGGDGSGRPIGPANIHESRGGSEAQAQPNYDFTQVTTAVRGTIGHIAPEYLSTGKCSVKNDVFGYGMMLLELITGQRAFDLARLANDDDVMLVDWVQGLMTDDKLEVVVDSDISTDYIKEEVEHLLELALLCTEGRPMDRPVMSEVVKMIENLGKRPFHDQLIRRRKDLRPPPEKEKEWKVQSPAQSVTESEWMVLGRS